MEKRIDSINQSEVDILDIFKIVFANKLLILLSTFFFGLSGLIFSFFLTDKYESTAVFAINKESNSTLSSFENQFGGIANIAGISLPNSGNDKTSYVIEKINSREFLKHLLDINGIRESLAASKAFDTDKQEIIFDDGIFDPVDKVWIRKPPKGRQIIPSYIEIHEKFYLKNLNVDHNKTTDLVEIKFQHVSPIFASEFLNLIFKELNELERQKDLKESKKALEYLSKQKSETTQTDLIEMTNKLLEIELKQQMLSSLNENYVMEPVDSPIAPEIKSSPNRMLITIMLSILGTILSSFFVIIRSTFSTN